MKKTQNLIFARSRGSEFGIELNRIFITVKSQRSLDKESLIKYILVFQHVGGITAGIASTARRSGTAEKRDTSSEPTLGERDQWTQGKKYIVRSKTLYPD